MKFYRCNLCGNIIVMVDDKGIVPNCCGKEMELLEAGTSDLGKEKHVPFIVINGNEIVVTVGEQRHPMEDDHYIQFIALETNGGYHLKFLSPQDDLALAKFILNKDEKAVTVYEYCNAHGLWKKELCEKCV